MVTAPPGQQGPGRPSLFTPSPTFSPNRRPIIPPPWELILVAYLRPEDLGPGLWAPRRSSLTTQEPTRPTWTSGAHPLGLLVVLVVPGKFNPKSEPIVAIGGNPGFEYNVPSSACSSGLFPPIPSLSRPGISPRGDLWPREPFWVSVLEISELLNVPILSTPCSTSPRSPTSTWGTPAAPSPTSACCQGRPGTACQALEEEANLL